MEGIYDFGAALQRILSEKSAPPKLRPGKLGVVRWDELTDWAVEDLRISGMIGVDAEGLRLKVPAYLAFVDVVECDPSPHRRWILFQVTKAHLEADPRYEKLRDEVIKEMRLSLTWDGEEKLTPEQQRLSDEMFKIDRVVA